jgi:hypothetical protein
MIELWRRWTYRRYEKKMGSADDLAVFDRLVSGPWTLEMAALMPEEVLVRGPQMGGIDADTRRVIDLELARRVGVGQQLPGNLIALLALAVSALALYRSW